MADTSRPAEACDNPGTNRDLNTHILAARGPLQHHPISGHLMRELRRMIGSQASELRQREP
ncbi:MAG: hypothetical protein ACRERD_14615 [Candidatus Binatia bacterium]